MVDFKNPQGPCPRRLPNGKSIKARTEEDILGYSAMNRRSEAVLGEPRPQDDMRAQCKPFGRLITTPRIADPLRGRWAKQRHRERVFENPRRCIEQLVGSAQVCGSKRRATSVSIGHYLRIPARKPFRQCLIRLACNPDADRVLAALAKPVCPLDASLAGD
jgi:hypothetical protein